MTAGAGRGATGPRPTVTVAVPTLDEEAHIAACLDSVAAQTYTHVVEVLVADGGSVDGTRALASARAGVRVLDNPGRIQSAGLNVALAAAQGEVFVRVDAHCTVAPDYVERCVDALAGTGAAMVGGAMRPRARGWLPRGIAAAMASPVGAGPARFHGGGPSGWVDTVYLGAYRTALARELGGYAVDLGVNEDAELAYRMRAHGGVWLDAGIRSTYAPRSTLAAVARQFYRYGRSRAATVRRHPRSLAPRQLVAPLLVLGLCSRWRRPLAAAYGGVVAAEAARHLASDPASAAGLALSLPVMHLPWGVGFLRGLVSPQRPPAEAVNLEDEPPWERSTPHRLSQTLWPGLQPRSERARRPGLQERAGTPDEAVDDRHRPGQVAANGDQPVAEAEGGHPRGDLPSAGRGPVLDDETRVEDQPPTGAQEPEPEVDLLGGVEEALVLPTDLEQGGAATGECRSHEVGARPRLAVGPGRAAEGVLRGDGGAVGVANGHGEDGEAGVGEPGPQRLDDRREEDGVIVEEHDHLGLGPGEETVAPGRDPDVDLGAHPGDARAGRQRRVRGHVQHDDLVPPFAGGRCQRVVELRGPFVTDDAEGDGGHGAGSFAGDSVTPGAGEAGL